MLRLAALLLVLLAALPAVTHAGVPGVPGPDESRAFDILEATYDAVLRRWPGCRLQDPLPETSDKPVPAELAAAVSVFRRRPATQEELALPRPFSLFGSFLPSSVRIVRTLPDGLRLVVHAELWPFGTRQRPRACAAREARELRRRLRGERPRVRRAALRRERSAVADERWTVTLPATIPVALVDAVRRGEDVPEGLAVLRATELDGPPTVSALRRGERTLLLAIVPDGVARVEVTTRRIDRTRPGVGRGRALVSSGRPVDNVVAIPVDRPHRVALMTHARWLAADGSVVSETDCPEGGC